MIGSDLPGTLISWSFAEKLSDQNLPVVYEVKRKADIPRHVVLKRTRVMFSCVKIEKNGNILKNNSVYMPRKRLAIIRLSHHRKFIEDIHNRKTTGSLVFLIIESKFAIAYRPSVCQVIVFCI